MPPASQDNYESDLGAADGQVASFEDRHHTPLQRLQHFLHGNPAMVPVIILLLSVIVFGFVAGGRFFSLFNLSLIMQQVAIVGILACAQTLIILTAGIDLSVAAIMVLSYVIMGHMSVTYGWPTGLAVVAGLLVAMGCGAVNGLLVTRIKLPPFIVTLGTWRIFLAIVYLYTGSQSIRSQDIDAAAPLLKFFGERVSIGGAVFTYGVFLMLGIFALFWYILNRTAWGRHVYAVGDDREAADLAGIRTGRVLLSVYIVAGLICGIAAWAAIGRVGSVSPSSFFEANLNSITAVVIGGTSLFGGRGAILGSLFGALIVGVFSSGLKLAGADPQWELFAIGCLIILAVALDQWIRRVSV
ncbi:ABC transporter permease [Oceanomicrobium pacificus]|uniref:ABC transporter permease n=1 Tax=Oceanomicrobium pacificus TaxID=2692916 RepID=A0A6B0TP94_9RHOB|nr:ABC transporter permease [Oceanomicrobium pacificus]MXU66440.1 ABC transporter permease [Oceanomicrobium pacificus]